MTDQALRVLERQILAEPAQLDLRRTHAQLLARAGDEDRALGALDLACRLGADDLWDELRARLEARRRTVGALTLCYVPGGPFAMGAERLDADAAPLHLVHLSAFYVAREPLTRAGLPSSQRQDGWPWTLAPGPQRDLLMESVLRQPVTSDHPGALAVIEELRQTAPVEGLSGRWALISEAQWERVFRAANVRKDGLSPYGPRLDALRPEWTADRYDSAGYGDGPRRDPTGAPDGDLWVVRGVPGLPPDIQPVYREAARDDGGFEVGGFLRRRRVRHEHGIAVRPVFQPDRAP